MNTTIYPHLINHLNLMRLHFQLVNDALKESRYLQIIIKLDNLKPRLDLQNRNISSCAKNALINHE